MAEPGGQRGIALVLVLWVIALLTVMAASLTWSVRTDTGLSGMRVAEAQLRALADAALNVVVLRLHSREPEDHWLPDGNERTWWFAGHELRLRLYNETSRIDLNYGSDQALSALIQILGLDSANAEKAVALIRDWKDQDDVERFQGAEDASYPGLGMPYGSKDMNFEAVSELSLLPPPVNELALLLREHVSIHARSSRVVTEYAHPLVLQALELTGQTISPQQRPLADGDASKSDAASKPPGAQRRNLGGPVYRLRVSLSGRANVVEIVFRLGGRHTGAEVLSRSFDWMEPPAVEAD